MRVEGTADINKELSTELDILSNSEIIEKQVNELIKAQEEKENTATKDDLLDKFLETEDIKQTKIDLGLETPIRTVKSSMPRLEPLTDEDRELAYDLALVPKAYKNAYFDIDRIKANIKSRYERSKRLRLVFNFDRYTKLCNSILSTIRLGELPKRSYIIGAPNGFGRKSFVSECIITLNKNGYTTAPYIALRELSTIRKYENDVVLRPYSYVEYKSKIAKNAEEREKLDKDYIDYYRKNSEYALQPRKRMVSDKQPLDMVWKRFSYDEYICAACVFVGLTEPIDKEIESYELKQLLTLRGMKGLPTIVMTGDSIEAYMTDTKLREQVWDEIITYDENIELYDMLYHVSCYTYKAYGVERKGIQIEDESLGLVKEKQDGD